MTEQPQELPCFVVTSANWTAEIFLDEYNAQFPLENQIFEAATRAVETFQNKRNDFEIKLNPDSVGEKPLLGTTLLVHLKNTDPEKAAVVLTHICLADFGNYEDSKSCEKIFKLQLEELKKQQEENERLKKELEEFDAFKEQVLEKQKKEVKKTKKTKKKKSDNDE